jgi:hypothetical protein
LDNFAAGTHVAEYSIEGGERCFVQSHSPGKNALARDFVANRSRSFLSSSGQTLDPGPPGNASLKYIVANSTPRMAAKFGLMTSFRDRTHATTPPRPRNEFATAFTFETTRWEVSVSPRHGFS